MIAAAFAVSAFVCAALALPRLARGPTAVDRAAAAHLCLRAIALATAALGVAESEQALVLLAAALALADQIFALAALKAIRAGPFQTPLVALDARESGS